MKDYIDDINVLKSNVMELMKALVENKDNDEMCYAICCEIQQLMIDTGAILENEAGLQDSPIIKWLEVCCEFCYQLSAKKIDAEAFYRYMTWQMLCVEYRYYWSVPKDAHELSVAAIIKNERNIIEWLEYHLLVGVDHFYIFDNESTDGLRDKLQSYIDEGVVTYIFFPGKYQQHPASNYAIEHFKYETKWLAIIDGDEYIVPVREGKKLPQVLAEIEQHFMNHPMRNMWNVGAIGVNWRDYGTSGHKTICDGLIIENYNYRAEKDYFQHAHIKSVYNPRVVTHINNPHFGHFIPNWICISEKGSFIPGSYFYDSTCEEIRINHYFSKSEEELISKNKRGWPDRDLHREDTKELYEAGVNCNKVYDPIMERYVKEVKQRIQEREKL